VRHRRLTGSRVAETAAPFKDYSSITANHQGGLQEGTGGSDTLGGSCLPEGWARKTSGEARVTINRAEASTGANSHRGTA